MLPSECRHEHDSPRSNAGRPRTSPRADTVVGRQRRVDVKGMGFWDSFATVRRLINAPALSSSHRPPRRPAPSSGRVKPIPWLCPSILGTLIDTRVRIPNGRARYVRTGKRRTVRIAARRDSPQGRVSRAAQGAGRNPQRAVSNRPTRGASSRGRRRPSRPPGRAPSSWAAGPRCSALDVPTSTPSAREPAGHLATGGSSISPRPKASIVAATVSIRSGLRRRDDAHRHEGHGPLDRGDAAAGPLGWRNPEPPLRPPPPYPTPFHSRGGSKASPTGPTPITILRMAPVNLLSYAL